MSIQNFTIALSETPQRLGSATSRRSYLEMAVDSGTAYVGGPGRDELHRDPVHLV